VKSLKERIDALKKHYDSVYAQIDALVSLEGMTKEEAVKSMENEVSKERASDRKHHGRYFL
jgi:DNA-binding ferritin-like protein (Dps family)